MGPTPAKHPTMNPIPKVLVWDEMRPVTETVSILMHYKGGLAWSGLSTSLGSWVLNLKRIMGARIFEYLRLVASLKSHL